MSALMQNYSVRKIRKDDLPEIVRIHSKSFSDRALIKLGKEAVRRYYVFLLDEFPLSEPICATNQERLVGFCFAGVYSGSFSGYIRKNLLFLVGQVLIRPWLLFSQLFRELGAPVLHVLKKIVRRRKGKKPSKTQLHTNNDSVSINKWGVLAIAVDPAYQRQGIGDLLMGSVEEHALKLGIDHLDLSVHPENTPAVRFYEKLGWEKVQTSAHWDGKMMKRLI